MYCFMNFFGGLSFYLCHLFGDHIEMSFDLYKISITIGYILRDTMTFLAMTVETLS